MTLNPGQKTTVSMEFNMHGAMAGPHNFRLHLPNNDTSNPDVQLSVISNWVP
jgi:hypothetical protein